VRTGFSCIRASREIRGAKAPRLIYLCSPAGATFVRSEAPGSKMPNDGTYAVEEKLGNPGAA